MDQRLDKIIYMFFHNHVWAETNLHLRFDECNFLCKYECREKKSELVDTITSLGISKADLFKFLAVDHSYESWLDCGKWDFPSHLTADDLVQWVAAQFNYRGRY